MSTLIDFDKQLTSIEATIAKGDTSPALLGELAKLEAAIDVAAAREGYTPALPKAASRDLYDGLDDETDDGDDTEPDDDEDSDTPVRKVYGRTVSATAGTNTAPSPTTKWNAAVERIAAERGISKVAAARAARVEHPLWFQAMQDSDLPDTTDQTLTALGKSASAFDRIVQDHIARGDNPIVAMQKAANSHPHLQRASEDLAKSESGVVAFLDCITEIRKRDGCDHITALRTARIEHPREFARYQNV